jgi:hypothetical protein
MIDPCSEIEPNIDFAETQWLTLGAATLCVIERMIEAIENDPERAADRPGTDRRLVEEEMPEAVDAGWTPRANGETRAKIVAPKRELVAIFSRCGIVEGSERPRRRPVASVFDLSDGETQVGDRALTNSCALRRARRTLAMPDTSLASAGSCHAASASSRRSPRSCDAHFCGTSTPI